MAKGEDGAEGRGRDGGQSHGGQQGWVVGEEMGAGGCHLPDGTGVARGIWWHEVLIAL